MYTNATQWKRIRKRILVEHASIRSVARREGMSRNTVRKIVANESPVPYAGRTRPTTPKPRTASKAAPDSSPSTLQRRWMDWLYALEQRRFEDDPLVARLSGCTLGERRRLLTVLAHQQGFSMHAIAQYLAISRTSTRRYLQAFRAGGVDGVMARKARTHKSADPAFQAALFALLHEPPTLSGFNRTTWRISDLRVTLAQRGLPASVSVVREALQHSGFRWRSAKVVLTSTDPDYREKLARIHEVLEHLAEDERFFSVDEYGPFAIKAKPGRRLVAPDEHPSVAQWQKSKGWLIATAALELSRNQVTHYFYSRAKNTTEMIRMVETLVAQYRDVRTLYLSWDAASWHMSKELHNFIDRHNKQAESAPRIELVPLPASAQFLNVIESVFSGMARAIIHNSDYPTVQAARTAIDQYFRERNRHFAEHPKRAGQRIWGKERAPAEFDDGNNCKDPTYR